MMFYSDSNNFSSTLLLDIMTEIFFLSTAVVRWIFIFRFYRSYWFSFLLPRTSLSEKKKEKSIATTHIVKKKKLLIGINSKTNIDPFNRFRRKKKNFVSLVLGHKLDILNTNPHFSKIQQDYIATKPHAGDTSMH